MGSILTLAFTAIILENIILSQFLGTCPFLGVSTNKKSATGMGLAVIVVITIAAMVSWLLYTFVLNPLGMTFMSTIFYILIIASLVQILEMFLKKAIPALYKSLGIYLPLITTNCAVLGVAAKVTNGSYSFLDALVYSFSTSVGFLLVMYIFSTLRSKMNLGEKNSFSGVPIALITAGIMAIIFARFSGVI